MNHMDGKQADEILRMVAENQSARTRSFHLVDRISRSRGKRYLELGSLPAFAADLKVSPHSFAEECKRHHRGVHYTTGPLSYLFRNRIYVGEISHKGEQYQGEHEPLLDKTLFNSVQAQLTKNVKASRRAPEASPIQ